MKKNLFLVFALLFFTIFESTILDGFVIFNVKPDFVLATVVILGFLYRPRATIIFSCFAGFFKDILSLGPIGLNTAIFILLGLMLSMFSKSFLIEAVLLRMLFVAIAVFIKYISAQVILFFYASPLSLGIFLKHSLLTAIYTAAITPLIIKMCESPLASPDGGMHSFNPLWIRIRRLLIRTYARLIRLYNSGYVEKFLNIIKKYVEQITAGRKKKQE